MRETGTIVKVEDGLAKVQIKRHTACGDCGACQVGQEKLVMETLAKNPVSAKIGDQVEIETETTNVLKASLIMYIFPLIMFIIGSLLGYTLANLLDLYIWNNYIGFAVGILFTLLSYMFIKINEKRFVRDKSFQATICKVIE